MENLLIYLVKSSTLLLLFYTTYYFLLKKDTFFNTNRWFLLSGLFISALLPLLTIEKTVWVEPAIPSGQPINVETISTTAVEVATTIQSNVFSWEIAIAVLYGIGVTVFLTQLTVEFYSLRKIIRRKNRFQSDGFEFIEVNELISPFSFFKKIVYNPNLFQTEELENIIEHEKIHAKQLHSLDVLIGRIYCILFWWNPIVWFYKKAMIQNLEFIADQNALAKAVDKKSYLLTLLKITTAEKHVAITNHFYQSLIKKRIVMLHKNQSKKQNSWKYFIVLPALVFFILTYQVEVLAQVKESNQDVSLMETSSSAKLIIDASSTNKTIKKEADFFSKEFGLSIKFKKISRNKKGEITKLSVTLSDKKGNTKVYDVSESEAIKPFSIFVNIDGKGKQTFGFGAPKENQHLKQHFEAVERNENNAQPKQVIMLAYEKDGKSMMKSAPGSEVTIAELEVKDKTDFLKNTLIVVDDKVISEEDYYKMDANSIKSVKVVKRKKDTDARYEALFKKYGALASNGILDIKTNGNGKSTLEENTNSEMYFNYSSADIDQIQLIVTDKKIDYKKALIYLNDKEISYKEMLKIDSENIRSVSKLNAKDNPKFIAKYGERGKNGVILIQKKSNEYSDDSIDSSSLNLLQLGTENEGFIITKKSQKSDFEFYQKYLNQIGVNAKISGIERNTAGFITAIKIKLVDEKRNHKMSENWITSKNPNGIPDISIGRKNGKLSLSAN